ncbi:MAG: hypothetical protein M3O46_08690 [Myxococcota bacterium]|nr:hypothetical protein [Myxococcota bacterium]
MRLCTRVVSAFALIVVAVVLTGCGGPKWIILKQASPNAMTPGSKFVIEPASFDPSFRVGEKTEQEWMGEKKAETQEKWAGDKVAMSQGFVEGFMAERENILVDSGPAGVFSVRARYTNYDPGYYAVIASAPTMLDANVEFLDGSGQPVDVIRIRVKNGAYSAGQGARACAKEIGAVTAKYLRQRLGL